MQSQGQSGCEFSEKLRFEMVQFLELLALWKVLGRKK